MAKPEGDVVDVGGIRVTSLVDTVLDLARMLPPAEGLAAMDAALSPSRDRTLTLDQLTERRTSQRQRRGSARVKWVLDRADGAAESSGESISRAVIEWCGFEAPQLQRVFRYEGATDRADFFFSSAGVVGESDGWGKYNLSDPEEATRHLKAEKRREDRLRRFGHGFARWDHAGLWAVAPVDEALRAAGLSRVRAPQLAMLATLRDRRRRAAH